jgi:diacylglycerol kinase (ATP)
VLHHGPALNLTVANGACFGGGLRISPGSDPADGVLDLVVIGAIGRLRGLRALSRLRDGTHVGMREVHTMPIHGPIQIRRGPGIMELEADGENLDAEGELHIEILPGRLTVMSINDERRTGLTPPQAGRTFASRVPSLRRPRQ